MDWLTHMNRALDYIEAHLDGEMDSSELARVACCPPGFFQRIFALLADLPLSEYVRRRRLTLAAQDLAATDERIIDIALRYGYDSPDAFTVAFKRLHGVSPSAAREQGVVLKAFPRMTFALTVKGVTEMNYRIEQHPAFCVTGRTLRVSRAGEAQYQTIPAFWTQSYQEGLEKVLCALGGGSVTGSNLLGVCYGEMEGDLFSYMIGAGNDSGGTPEGLVTLTIPASTWAIFDCVGPMPGAIQAVWKRIAGEFLPASPYNHAGTPDFELYYPGSNDDPGYRSEVWIPVVNK